MMYHVYITEKAFKQLSKLPKPIQKKISENIDALSDNPRPAQSKKLKGYDDLYRIRIADYRVVYEIVNQQVLITILRVAHRKDVYK